MTLQSPTATLIPKFSSSELTGCGYPGLLNRKIRSDMCPRWESNPRLPACKASTLSTRPGSPQQQAQQSTADVLYLFTLQQKLYLQLMKYNSSSFTLWPQQRDQEKWLNQVWTGETTSPVLASTDLVYTDCSRAIGLRCKQ